MILVLDTNILIAAVIKDSATRRLITLSDETLLFPEMVLKEIRQHKKEILAKSNLTEEQYDKIISKLLEYVDLVPAELIRPHKDEAMKLIGDVDIGDVPLIATALAIEGSIIWSNDQHLKKQDKIKVLTTKELMELRLI